MGTPLKSGVCKAPCFLDEGNFTEISCPENLAIFSDPKLKTVKLLPHSKECGFKFMDITKNLRKLMLFTIVIGVGL